uniref:Uncharacterized protein n=1 Tax=Rhizophora mucronata TaxID=61149 RepID=A0A2P2Q2H7_RHIMU
MRMDCGKMVKARSSLNLPWMIRVRHVNSSDACK